jgi:hypothetical protein
MDWFGKAVVAAYTNLAEPKTNSDLDIPRDREDFRELLRQVESKPASPAEKAN